MSDIVWIVREWLDDHRATFLCYLFGHPGVTWYNSTGLEPDMHCSRCGKDLS
jgi:hypothetical protein